MGNRAVPAVLGLTILFLAAAGVQAGDLASVATAKVAAANTSRPVEDVMGKFAVAEAELERLVDAATTPATKADLQWQWATLLSAKGVFVGQSIERNPKLDKSIGAAGILALKGARAQYLAVAKTRQQMLKAMPAAERAGQAGTKLSWELRRARFHACTASYRLGQVLPVGATAREDQLQATNSQLKDFLWENEDNLLGGYAYVYIGLTEKELGHPKEAVEFLKVAASAYPVPPTSDAENHRKWTDLFLQGYFKLVEYCNELGEQSGEDYRQVALKELDRMPKRVPELWQRQFGHLAVIEQARALKSMGRVKEAKALLERVIKESKNLPADQYWGASTAFLAEQVLVQITAEAVLPPTAVELFRAAKVAKSQHKWAEAEKAYLAAIDAAKTEEEIRDLAIPAWMQIGECRYRDGRFKEAYDAYGHLLSEYESLGTDLGGDAAYYRYRAATALHGQTRDPGHQALKKQARMEFAESFPDHPRAIDLRYYAGADLIAEGDQLLSEEKRDAAFAAYARAVELFVSVKQKSVLYAKSRARVVEVHNRTGAHEEALKGMAGLLAFIDAPKHITTDPQRVANRRAAGAIVTFYGARSLEKLERWQEMFELLEGFEAKYSAEAEKGFHPSVKAARERAQQKLEPGGDSDD